MKKVFVSLSFFALLFIVFSCNKDEIDDLNKDVDALQDSLNIISSEYYSLLYSFESLQNYIVENDSMDIKAMKMEQIGYLFAAISRQPEASGTLINATEILYSDISELLPINDKAIALRGRARGLAFAQLFYSVARQPEASAIMDTAAEKFLGAYSADMINDEMMEISISYASANLLDAIARQPEADSILNALAIKYLNRGFITEE